jgi:purine-binding chemotaxis protein CheW
MSVRDDIGRELRDLKVRLYELERVNGELEAEAPLPPDQAIDVLVCKLDEHRIAFELTAIREVIPAVEAMALPEAPPWILGVVNVRGQVVPVVDVSARVERRAGVIGLTDNVVICEHENRGVGLLVRDIVGVERLMPGAGLAGAVPTPCGPYVRSTLSDDQGLILLFSISRLVTSSDLPEAALEVSGAAISLPESAS